MSTAELIYEKAKALPAASQAEALQFVNFLLSQKDAKAEGGEWARFSAVHLEKQYVSSDEIYDQD